MSRIRSKDTKPEKLVRSILHHMGYRFRLHVNTLPGKPDIVLPRYQTVVFVHGCFWHRHPGCKYAYTPKSRVKFWNQKFEQNVARHREVMMDMQQLGWHSITVWECETRDLEKLSRKLTDNLSYRNGKDTAENGCKEREFTGSGL